jgi:hypothetical protein
MDSLKFGATENSDGGKRKSKNAVPQYINGKIRNSCKFRKN